MRDVTDKRTGELEEIEVKRGRGRLRKEGALSNAQRQAGFRARCRAESVTVTKIPQPVVSQVDAYDECRIEVDSLRVALAETDKLFHEAIEAREVARAELARSHYDVSVLLDKNCDAEREIDRLCKELAEAKKGVAKSVTASNGNPVSFDNMVQLILLASKARTQDQRDAILESGSFSAVFKNADVSSQQLQAVEWALSAGKRASQVGV
jgi:hypothetical protein